MHISNAHNPADIASRGVLPSLFFQNSWDIVEPSIECTNNCELKENFVTLVDKVTHNTLIDYINTFWSLLKMQRVYAFINRFIHNGRNRQNKFTGPLKVKSYDSHCKVLSR